MQLDQITVRVTHKKLRQPTPSFAEWEAQLGKMRLGRLIIINQKRHMKIPPGTLLGGRQGIGYYHQMQFIFTQVIPRPLKIETMTRLFPKPQHILVKCFGARKITYQQRSVE